jgi:uncharacterized membrane protein
MSVRKWIKLAAVTLVLAVALHVLLVWSIPIAITSIFMSRVSKQAGANHVVASPLPTDKSRQVVKPSPDLLYALCIFDVSAGLVRVSIEPPATYWSLSLFDRNTDNFFTLNTSKMTGGKAELVLGTAASAADAKIKFPAASFVQTPHTSGVMLARILVLDQSSIAAALEAQHSVRCEPATDRS